MIEWRWDQGRILYFQFDVIKEIAKVLIKFENKDINENKMPLSMTTMRIKHKNLLARPFIKSFIILKMTSRNKISDVIPTDYQT